jgi:hypothetical protein
MLYFSFQFTHWRMPRVSSRDKCLHTVFFINLVIMVSCAMATILCFLSDRGQLQELPKLTPKGNGQDKQVCVVLVSLFISLFLDSVFLFPSSWTP